jgi:pimeloyl-ACP methyl ester carboxylesterase
LAYASLARSGGQVQNRAVKKRLALLAVLILALAASAPPADAARFKKCPENPYLRCISVGVPLDHFGGARGRINLRVERLRGPGRSRRRGALVALAGGPGQSATASFGETFFQAIDPAVRGRDLILFDQRGTGRSGVLRCPRFERVLARLELEREAAEAEACANRIGGRRAYYTTRQSVEDVEAVRRAIGVARISIYGVSYGSKVALAYAMKYPSRVERLVLDSVQETGGPDPLYRDTFSAIPRTLGSLCANGACPFTSDPGADVAELVRRLSDGDLSGTVIDPSGRPRTKTFSRLDMFFTLLAGDFDPPFRAATPAAVASALRGDPAPLLRLAKPELPKLSHEVRAFSEAVFAATVCEEAPLPWDRAAPVDQRPGQLAATVDGVPESAFYPFNRATVLETEFIRICSRWPSAPDAPVLDGAPPDVPALLLNGEDDLRTPMEEARRVQATLPRASLVEAGATGHSVLADPTRCITRALARFFAGRSVPAACPKERQDKAAPLAPLSLDEVAPAPGVADRAGRTAAAVGLTVRDVDQFSNLTDRGGGLRGGRFRFLQELILTKVVFVPGVEVSGTLDYSSKGHLIGRVRVGGADAAGGTLRIRPGGRLVGTLDGQRVDTRVDLGGGLGKSAGRAPVPRSRLGPR